MVKKVLCIQRHSPGLLAREALDLTLVAGVFDQKVTVLFRDDGILQLTEACEGDASSDANALEESIRSLTDYGIEKIFVCADSLRRAELHPENLIVPVKVLSADEQSALIAEQDMVLND